MDINNPKHQAEFISAFFICALWSSTAYGDPDWEAWEEENGGGSCDHSFEYLNYDEDDFAPESKQKLVEDCMDFMQSNAEDLEHWDAELAGHDFWLTRCGHGAGFWDRHWGDDPLAEVGDRLTESCRPYGNVDLYVGDDGLIHC